LVAHSFKNNALQGSRGKTCDPIIRNIGKVLRLVGISSPEDLPKAATADDPPDGGSRLFFG
jgi:hypothetical protein